MLQLRESWGYRELASFCTRSSTGRPVFLLAVTAARAAALRTVKLRPGFGFWELRALAFVVAINSPFLGNVVQGGVLSDHLNDI